MTNKDLVMMIREIAEQYQCSITSVLGSQKTSMKIGGMLQHVLEVNTEEQIINIARSIGKNNIKMRVLGAGSNLIIPSSGVEDVIITLGNSFDYVETFSSNKLKAGASTMLPALSLKLCQQGLAGLSFAAGIPGTLGGGIRMNCGAHHGEIANMLERIRFFSFEDNTFYEINKAELTASYRKINIPLHSLIVSAELSCVPSDSQKLLAERQSCLQYRKDTQPLQFPSAGSVFRNPDKELTKKQAKEYYSAGALIEQLGLKGTILGGAQISDLHANWIINPKRNATSDDVRALVDMCQVEVALKKNVRLKPEIVFW